MDNRNILQHLGQPKKIIKVKDNRAEFLYLKMVDDEIEEDYNSINALTTRSTISKETTIFTPRISKENYLEKVGKMKDHIQRGDIYEANFCQEFYIENQEIDPLQSYLELNEISSPPFAAFLRLEEHYALSASPERYIKKKGKKVISQPIKGTAKRLNKPEEDEILKSNLQIDPKEIAENVMIVDLVRNDLSKTAFRGSVNVDELCKLYTFKQVHQLISTVSSQIREDVTPVEVLKTTFPMGSMTGAPKVSAMKIIEELEEWHHKKENLDKLLQWVYLIGSFIILAASLFTTIKVIILRRRFEYFIVFTLLSYLLASSISSIQYFQN